jgi:hypothetical protein
MVKVGSILKEKPTGLGGDVREREASLSAPAQSSHPSACLVTEKDSASQGIPSASDEQVP